MLLLPTAPTIYRVAEVAAEPILLNSRLGTYTNFVNLLDLRALALPAGFRPDGLPLGITLDGSGMERPDAGGAAGRPGNARYHCRWVPPGVAADEPDLVPAGEPLVELAVVGAHLSGGPLNHELRRLGAQLVRTTRTTGDYRLYALAGTNPAKPGLVRSPGAGGLGIEVEVWALAATALGELLAKVAAPLGDRHGRAGRLQPGQRLPVRKPRDS